MGRFSGLSMTISLMVWPSSELTANPETGDPSTNSEVPAYTLRLIETPGYFELEVFGMNNLGQIGGGLAHGDPGHENHEHTAFLFNSNTAEAQRLPCLPFPALTQVATPGGSATRARSPDTRWGMPE
ncbi:MAG TPA: hypothetical protein VKN35_09830 [Xanthomonadales bacterium]|nr:hypothetical protein [Xanthomonadales bacterium]